jgi:hypothetical protein
MIKAKRIIILDMVYDEIIAVKDGLGDWLKTIKDLEPLNHKTPEILKHYSNILAFIRTSRCYKAAALHGWAEKKRYGRPFSYSRRYPE